MANAIQLKIPAEAADDVISQIPGLQHLAMPAPKSPTADAPSAMEPPAIPNAPLGQIAPLPQPAQPAKPQRSTLGKVGNVLGEIGGTALSAAAPGIAQYIPSTPLGRIEQQDRAETMKEREANIQARQAQAQNPLLIEDKRGQTAKDVADIKADSAADVTGQKVAGAKDIAELKALPKDAAGNAVKMGALKPNLVAQVGEMPQTAEYNGKTYPDVPSAQKAWGQAYDALSGKSGKATGLGTYAMIRLLDWASRNEPEILRATPQILQQAGIVLPPGTETGIPPGQPRNEAGQPIGTAMPEAPTGSTRSRGQFAQSAITDQIPGIEKEIDALGNQLGPISGRYNELITGTLGADNPAFYGLRTGLQNIATAWMRLHANSDEARKEFEDALSRAKSPSDLKAALDSIDKQAKDYVKLGKGNQAEGGSHPAGGGTIIKYDAQGNRVK